MQAMQIIYWLLDACIYIHQSAGMVPRTGRVSLIYDRSNDMSGRCHADRRERFPSHTNGGTDISPALFFLEVTALGLAYLQLVFSILGLLGEFLSFFLEGLDLLTEIVSFHLRFVKL